MNRVVDVVIPSLGKSHVAVCMSLLRHIPWPIKLHVIVEGKSWSEAVNLGLDESTGDVILMDDDIFLRPTTFSFMNQDKVYEQADIFGFKLLYPDGRIQHAGGYYDGNIVRHYGHTEKDSGQYDVERYVAHATTSLIYIKRHVVADLKGMARDMPGMQFEDVDFCFRSIKAGYKILYTPGDATHLESATKRYMVNFHENMERNWKIVQDKHLGNKEFLNELIRYRDNDLKPLARV